MLLLARLDFETHDIERRHVALSMLRAKNCPRFRARTRT
jgi:hypothetical protein